MRVALSMAGCRHSLLSLQDGARNLYRVVNGQVVSEAAASCYAETSPTAHSLQALLQAFVRDSP